jgi:hypothetical protein
VNVPPLKSACALWGSALRAPSVWARGAKLGLSVGLLQAAVNQGDQWVSHHVDGVTLIKTIISPLITFSVALASAAATYVDKLKLNS